MTDLFYAGVGSRHTPRGVLGLMTRLAQDLAFGGWILRTGHAAGADQAFEVGAGRFAQVFLPWARYNHEAHLLAPSLSRPAAGAYQVAAKHHLAWSSLSNGAKDLHARNAHIILGPELDDPVSFVACWTRNGAESAIECSYGGTGMAIRIADAYGVPVFNLRNHDAEERLRRLVEGLG
jgi:hypothetical protein